MVNMNDLRDKIKKFVPSCEQEENDKKIMLKYFDDFEDVLTRENEYGHFTASSWVLNEDRTKVLMIYHNIYNSWAWTGGHADGDADLLNVAIREVMEETGIHDVKPILDDIFSLEIICVNGHVKRGKYVSSHVHLNVTYLLEASSLEDLKIKEDENSGVKWIDVEEAISMSSEPWMHRIYQKLIDKSKRIDC